MFYKKTHDFTIYSYQDKFLNSNLIGFDPKQKPDWLKKLKSFNMSFDENTGINFKSPTIHSCPGIRDFIEIPIHIKMWCDATIKIWPEGIMTYKSTHDSDFNCGVHGTDQYGKDIYQNRMAVKLISPWHIQSKSNTKFLMMESHYSSNFFRENGLFSSPGVLNFKDQASTNVHINFPVKSEPYEIQLKYGQPLVSLFPLSESKIKLHYKRVALDEFRNLAETFPSVWTGRYYKKDKI